MFWKDGSVMNIVEPYCLNYINRFNILMVYSLSPEDYIDLKTEMIDIMAYIDQKKMAKQYLDRLKLSQIL